MQEIDERTADLNNKKAAVNSGQANVERLEALAGYKKIRCRSTAWSPRATPMSAR